MTDYKEKISEQLEECVEILLDCEEKNKKCWRCRKRAECRQFIRSVLGALCRMRVIELGVKENDEDIELMFA